MTEEELDKHCEALELMFGDQLPNPEQEPIRFAHYVKLYRYYTKPADLVVHPQEAQ